MNPAIPLVQAAIALQNVSQSLLTDAAFAFLGTVAVYVVIDVIAGAIRVRCARAVTKQIKWR